MAKSFLFYALNIQNFVHTFCFMKIQKVYLYNRPRVIQSSACSGTSNLENPVQKAEPLKAAL